MHGRRKDVQETGDDGAPVIIRMAKYSCPLSGVTMLFGKGGDLPLLQLSCCGIPSGSLRKSMRSQAECRARIKILLEAGRGLSTLNRTS
ncbi:hypothetical protein NQZ68_039896 [Dissostichus eleginoides]|nr:hypothetical protein NQZ68_039896 [Dissostichus eleginoides]